MLNFSLGCTVCSVRDAATSRKKNKVKRDVHLATMKKKNIHIKLADNVHLANASIVQPPALLSTLPVKIKSIPLVLQKSKTKNF